ncbi:hypothetical protein [Actinotalea sp.]|uniref:hypothetical protein n=1 Tax=Actinotalea sp. TaxID=1872145 RepID=UPI003566604D
MDSVLAALGALVPPVGVGLVFWLVLRSIIRADRAERAAIARLDAEEAGLVPPASGEAGNRTGAGPGAATAPERRADS